MKKALLIIGLLILLIAGGAWYALSGSGDFIRSQIETQGTKYLGTSVSVASVDVALTEGRMTISGLDVENPSGFSKEDAFSVELITLDLGEVYKEPYIVQTVNVNAPKILYEVDASGKGNLIALKNSLAKNLPKSDTKDASEKGSIPLLIVENVTVSNVRLKLNFENLSTGDLKIDTKVYEITLPIFNAGPIGQPNGMPADQAGIAIVNAMLDNVIAQAKSEAKKRLGDEAKRIANEKLQEEKDKLLDKASEKLKGLFKKD